jgi:hypothetical protein
MDKTFSKVAVGVNEFAIMHELKFDKKKKTFNILELTCPMEPNIKKKNSEKFGKYSHFLTDITCYTPTLTCFEIGSRGYVSHDNHAILKTIHSFCKPGIKIKKFKDGGPHSWVCARETLRSAPHRH